MHAVVTRFAILGLAVCAVASSCPALAQGAAGASPPVSAALHGDQRRPPAARWVRAELYFGIGNVDDPHPGQAEQRWREFLDREVTPRFPDGLTVVDGYGQWLPRGARQPERLKSKVLVILHENTAARRRDIDAIRTAWKKLTGDQSVLLASTPVQVSF